MITIKNTQRTIPVNTNKLKKDLRTLLKATNYEDFDIGVWITTDKTIRSFNKRYRHKDKATTILSFPYQDNIKAGERIKPLAEDDKNLGDLIISPKSIMKDAPTWDQTFEQRLQGTLVHGFCHLLGYTHETDEKFAQMLKKEAALNKHLQ